MEASLIDIEVCADALKQGIDTYSGGKVITRLKKNCQFIRVISKELKRRFYAKES
jgi:hypothetical protein